MEGDSSLLHSIFFPEKFEYKMSEKLFLDIWEKWGSPKEIINGKDVYNFLKEVIEKSEGLVILDHFSHINYDNIHSIQYEEPYTKIYWKDFDHYRKKFLEQTLNEDEQMIWFVNGYGTYLYMLLHINKIKFVKVKNHLFILFLLNLIPHKTTKQLLLKKSNELISEEIFKDVLYREYSFWEGDKKDAIKHICIVNNLPYYTCLIQSKEGNYPTTVSKQLLLLTTLEEIAERMNKVKESIIKTDQYAYDDLFSQGNTIRRIMEYSLKFLCLYKEIEMEIDEKYGYVKLGELKKVLNKEFAELNIEQSLVNIANELSHDSGKTFSKDEISDFWKEVKELLEKVNNIILESD